MARKTRRCHGTEERTHLRLALAWVMLENQTRRTTDKVAREGTAPPHAALSRVRPNEPTSECTFPFEANTVDDSKGDLTLDGDSATSRGDSPQASSLFHIPAHGPMSVSSLTRLRT